MITIITQCSVCSLVPQNKVSHPPYSHKRSELRYYAVHPLHFGTLSRGVAKNKRRSDFVKCKERRIEKITLGRLGFLFYLINMQCFATVSSLASKAE